MASNSHSGGREAVETSDDTTSVNSLNAQSATAISNLLRPALGPTGRDKMLVDSNGMAVVTNDGVTILGEIDVEMDVVPAARLLTELAHAQANRVGDGTKTSVIYASELVKEATELIDDGLHPTTIASGYRWAANHVSDVLTSLAVPVSTTDTGTLEDTARMAMTGRGPAGADDALARLVVEAIQMVDEGERIDADNVTTVKAHGGVINDSVLVRGLVLDTTEPASSGMPTSVADARTACVNTELDSSAGEMGQSSFGVSSIDQVETVQSTRAEILDKKVDHLVEQGVNVVFCTEGIDQTVRSQFAQRGILAFKRVTPEDVRNVCRATGAAIVSDVSGLDETDVGEADLVEERYAGSKRLLFLEGCESPKSVSIFLRGGTEHSLDESERAVENALSVVQTTLETEQVLPGGGAPEIEAARSLRSRASELAGREQLAARAFADVLETIPATIARNGGDDPLEIVPELRVKHQAGEENAGLANERGIVDDVITDGVVEPLFNKQRAISGATDITIQIIRIDDLLGADELEDYDFI